MTRKTKETAYALWALGLIGFGGLHRFYVGRTGSGVLYLLTFNLFFVGMVLDFFAIPALVAEANGLATPQQSAAGPSRLTQALIGIGGLMVLGAVLSRWAPVKPTKTADESRTASAEGGPSQTGAEPSEKRELPPGTYLIKDGYLGAVSKEILEKAIELLASKDEEAFDKLLKTNLVFPLQQGLEVTVVDHEGLLSSLVKVRKRGTLAEIWTVREALDTP